MKNEGHTGQRSDINKIYAKIMVGMALIKSARSELACQQNMYYINNDV